MIKKTVFALTLAISAISAQAMTFSVDATNTFANGSGVDTGISLQSGWSFSIIVDALHTWQIGTSEPRHVVNASGMLTNADGTAHQPLSVSGSGSFAAKGGQLVAQVGSELFALEAGDNTYSVNSGNGTLKLFAWDRMDSAADNSGSLSVFVSAVPEPSSIAMLLAGLGMMGFIARRRTTA